MMRIRLGAGLLLLIVSSALAAEAPAPSWAAHADCAAAYRANWQNRLSDPNRTSAMSAMIQEQSDDYRRAAVRAYRTERNASERIAEEAVREHMQTAILRYVAMDQAGTLESFIDKCPQLEPPSP